MSNGVNWSAERRGGLLVATDVDQVVDFMTRGVKRPKVLNMLGKVRNVDSIGEVFLNACQQFDYVTPLEFVALIESVMEDKKRLIGDGLPESWGGKEWVAVCNIMKDIIGRPEIREQRIYQAEVNLRALDLYMLRCMSE